MCQCPECNSARLNSLQALYNWGGTQLADRLITEGAFMGIAIPTSLMPTNHLTPCTTLKSGPSKMQINRNRKPLLSSPSALPTFWTTEAGDKKPTCCHPSHVSFPLPYLHSSNSLPSSQRSAQICNSGVKTKLLLRSVKQSGTDLPYTDRQKLQLLSTLPLIHIAANLGDHSEVKELVKQLSFFSTE